MKIIEEIYYCEGKPLKGDYPWQRFVSRTTQHSLPKAMRMLSAYCKEYAGEYKFRLIWETKRVLKYQK